MLREINFDGIVGPSHNYAGLSPGNIASASHKGDASFPRAAALQGLAKMRANMALGLAQGFLLPLPRPNGSLLRELAAIPGIAVGDNVPYSGQLKGDTLYQHGTLRGLAHALIEVRQDLILGPEGQEEWGERLASVVRKVLAADPSPRLHVIERYGSHTDGPGQGSG